VEIRYSLFPASLTGLGEVPGEWWEGDKKRNRGGKKRNKEEGGVIE